MTDKLKTIRDILVSIHDHVYHYQAPEGSRDDTYIVWQEESECDRLIGDGDKNERRIQGSVDLFTFTEYSPLMNQIESAFKDADVYLEFTGTGFEDATGLIHYEWVWRI